MFEGTLVALVTPMHEDGSIDIASLQKLVKSQAAQPIQGLVLVGSTGESSTLTVAEKLETVQIALDAAQGQVPIIAASNDNETNRTIALTRQFSELGVAGVLISSPAYSRPTQRGLAAHFQKILDQTSVPVILYNHPGRTSVDMSVELIKDLDQYSNVVALKEANSDLSRLQQLSEYGLSMTLLSGDDLQAFDMMRRNVRGVVSVTANLYPNLVSHMVQSFLLGDLSQADKMDKLLRPLHEMLCCESNPAPIKWAMSSLDRIPPGIRLPLLELSPKFHQPLQELLKIYENLSSTL